MKIVSSISKSKNNVISEPIIQSLLKSIDPKTLSQYPGVWKRFNNWINVSENACEVNRSLICDFFVRYVDQFQKSVDQLSLKQLTFKTLALIAITTSERGQNG